MGKLISRQEAANILGVSGQTLSNWVEKGAIPTHKVKWHGRMTLMFDKKTIEALQDDAKAIEESKKRLAQMRIDAETKERSFTFKALSKESERLDNMTFLELQDLALAFIKFASDNLSILRKECLTMFVEGKTLGEISEKFNLTKERVRQIIRTSARRLLYVKTFKDIHEENEELKARNNELKQSYDLAFGKLKGMEYELKELKYKLGIEDAQKIVQIEDAELANQIKLFNTNIKGTPLSVRALNCLLSADVETIGDLVQLNRSDLLKFRNFGKKTLMEIDEYLDSIGTSFGIDVESYFRLYNQKLKEKTLKEK